MAGPNILSRKRANILSRPSPPPVKFVEEKGKAKSCPFCPETFSTAGDLLRHKNHIHLGILPQECGFCSQDSFRLYGARGHISYFYCDQDLLRHVAEKHSGKLATVKAQQAAGVFICPRCPQVFRKQLAFRVHALEKHPADGPIKCKNHGCSIGFWTRKALEAHKCDYKPAFKIRVISDAKVDEGDDYGDIFGDDDLDNDEEGEKKDDRTSIKIKEYNTRVEYGAGTQATDIHPKHAHLLKNFKSFKTDSYECCECGSQFDSPDMLTSHLDLHEWAEKGAPPSENALTQCVLCQFRPAKSLSDSEKYRQMADHVITTHFNVSWPGLKPPVSEPPKDDKKTEDEEEDIVEVPTDDQIRTVCQVCYKEFENDTLLQIHIKYFHQHNTETDKQLSKLRTCPKCNKTCTSESQLRLHLSLYCNVSFPCDFCPSTFSQIKVLAVHVKAVHKGETVFIQSSEQNKEHVSEPQIVNSKNVTEQMELKRRQQAEKQRDLENDHINQAIVTIDDDQLVTFNSSASTRPITTNNTVVMVDEIDGEAVVEAPTFNRGQIDQTVTYEKFDTDEIPCIFCPARISSKGNAGMYPILGHMMGLHGKEKHWPCNKCDYRSDKMDLFFQHYKKHLNP